MELYQVLKGPIVTEKSSEQPEGFSRYTFEVHPRATKQEIRQAVEKLFDVHVVDVNTLYARGKTRRFGRIQSKTADRKKAVVTLAAGDKIPLFEGV
ncbi:MAG: 50S ribosomal protein L23 [Chloroflexota bacterium]